MAEELKQKIQEELRLLEAELRTEIPQELKRAVALGDLSENAEYEAARHRQDYVRARIGGLRTRLAYLSLMDTARPPHDPGAYGLIGGGFVVAPGGGLTHTVGIAHRPG